MNGQSNRLSREVNVLARRLRTAARIARTVMGVPDYERYLAHVRATHPNEPPLTRDEFARERLDVRYSRPGARCC
jgi:uncharacterized short protein YbdD (DUF466 family)